MSEIENKDSILPGENNKPAEGGGDAKTPPSAFLGDFPPLPRAAELPPLYDAGGVSGEGPEQPAGKKAAVPPPPVYRPAGYVPPVAPQPPQKVRRVGSFSMALGLIAVGVLLLLRLFVPALDYLNIIRFFAPMLLILLGLEILITNLVSRNVKIKYDILSFFFCVFLIGTGVVAAVVPEIVQYELHGGLVNNRLAAELTNKGQEALLQSGKYPAATVECTVDMRSGAYVANRNTEELDVDHYVQVRVYFAQEFESAQAFAAACDDAAKLLGAALPQAEYGLFCSDANNINVKIGEERYTLSLENQTQFGGDITAMLPRVQTEYWLEGSHMYISEAEYNDRLANPDNYDDRVNDTPDYADDQAASLAEAAEPQSTTSEPQAAESNESTAGSESSVLVGSAA